MLLMMLLFLNQTPIELSLAEQAVLVQERDLKLPDAQILIKEATLLPVLAKMGEIGPLVVGYVHINGEISATMQFEGEEARAAAHNFEGVEVSKRAKLNAKFEGKNLTSLTVDGSGILFSSVSLQGAPQQINDDQRRDAEKLFKKFQKRRDEVYYHNHWSSDPVFASVAAAGNGLPYLFWTQLPAGQPLAFFFDGVRSQYQGIYVFNDLDGIYKPEATFLATALGDLHRPNFPNLDVLQIQGDITTENNKDLNFNLNVSYGDPIGNTRLLLLNLFSSRVSEREKTRHGDSHELNYGSLTTTGAAQSLSGTEFGRLHVRDLIQYKRDQDNYRNTVHQVTNEKGENLQFASGFDHVLVDLGSVTQKGKPFSLQFQYGGPVAAKDLGTEIVHWDGFAWFPRGNIHHARPKMDLTITCKKDWMAIAPGKVKRKEKGDLAIAHFQMDRPVSHPNFFLGKFFLIEERVGGKDLNYYSYAQKRNSSIKKMHKLADQFYGFYSNLFGAIPLETMSFVEVKDHMVPEYMTTSLLTMGSDAFERFSLSSRNKEEADTNVFKGVNESIAVGMASLWWSSQVQPGSYYDEWFSIGIPEYAGYLLMKAAEKDDVEEKFTKAWQARAEYVRHLPISQATLMRDHAYTGIRDDLLRSKSALMLAELHSKVGDQHMFSLLNGFLRVTQFKAPTTLNMVQALQSITKSEELELFDQSFWGFE